jgi:hypothetical protein
MTARDARVTAERRATEAASGERPALDACVECREVCSEALVYCLSMGGAYLNERLLGDLMDCTALCQAAADLLRRGSGLQRDVCAVLADACDFAAESCGRLAGDDLLQRAADACRRCAHHCRAAARVGLSS